MFKRFIFLALTLIIYDGYSLFGQSKFSVSGGVGYNANTIDFPFLILNYRLNKRIELTGGPSIHFFYLGQGLTAGIRIFYPLEKKFFMDTEITYRYLFNRTISISPADHDEDVGNYFVPSTNFIFLAEGINFIVKSKMESNGIERLNFSCYYRIPLSSYHYTFISGIESAEIEKEIERRISNGFGFSVSISAWF